MSHETPLSTARNFAEAHIAILSVDVLSWRNSRAVSEGRLLHTLAEMCIPVASDGDEYKQAEILVVQAALKQASYGNALHEALSQCVARGLSITLTEDELARFNDLLGQRQQTPLIDVASVQSRVGALISKIEGILPYKKVNMG